MKIAYITSSKIPTVNDAQAQRCVSIMKLFDNTYIDVISNCAYGCNNFSQIGTNRVLFSSYNSNNKQKRIDKIISHLTFHKVIASKLASNSYDLIIFNDFSVRVMHAIRKQRKNAVLLYDAVEWYSPSEKKLRNLSPTIISNNYANSIFVKDDVNVISISRYFQNYFEEKSINSFYMPVVLDKELYNKEVISHSTINLIYAGYMGKKDRISEFVQAFSDLPGTIKKRFILHIVGPSKENFENVKSFEQIKFYNYMPHDELLEMYQSMDFSILFRNSEERYAKAGFPTKLAESMMCGVPVICNLFSNIGDYLEDQINSIIVDEDDYSNVLLSLSSFSREKILGMKRKARITAEKWFYYESYRNDFSEFIAKLEIKNDGEI